MGILGSKFDLNREAQLWWGALDYSDCLKKWHSENIKIRKMRKDAKKSKLKKARKARKARKVKVSNPLTYDII